MTSSITGLKVLVLGGNGFLGTHLVQELLRQGAAVRVYGRSSAGGSDPNHKIEVFQGDFASGAGLEAALKGVDIVYHLISTTVPSTSNADPIADVHNNLGGSLRLIQMMLSAQVNRIVYVSSGGTVYGNPRRVPVTESAALQPVCSYGVVKVAVENYLHMYSELRGLVANVLRVSNPYGTHQHHIGVQGVIPTLFQRLRKGEPIEIWGDGSIVRDYIYVDDVVSALLMAGSSQVSGTYNIGSGVGHSLKDVLQLVCALTGVEGDIRYLPSRKFDVQRIYLDISLAQERLGWSPAFSLEGGCKRYWDLIRSADKI
jgi:UDP-glucose 4-epimerase